MIVTFISWLMSVGAVTLITFTLFAEYTVFDRFGAVEVIFNAKLFVKLLLSAISPCRVHQRTAGPTCACEINFDSIIGSDLYTVTIP